MFLAPGKFFDMLHLATPNPADGFVPFNNKNLMMFADLLSVLAQAIWKGVRLGTRENFDTWDFLDRITFVFAPWLSKSLLISQESFLTTTVLRVSVSLLSSFAYPSASTHSITSSSWSCERPWLIILRMSRL